MLGRGFSGTAWLYQAPSFPAGSTASRTLRFYLRINSAEPWYYTHDDLFRQWRPRRPDHAGA